MKWVGHVGHTGKTRNAYKILTAISERISKVTVVIIEEYHC
jgi:hypothetical protein